MRISILQAGARLLSLAALLTITSSAAYAQSAGIDPQAERLLRRMTDYMASLRQLSVDSHNTLEAVTASGEKIQFDAYANLVLQRPNMLRAERQGDLISQVFYYDGRTLTLYNPRDKLYATVAAPDTIESMLDFARDKLDVVAPGGDLFYRDAFARFMQVTQVGLVVDKAVIGGVKCDHLAFTGEDVDWQIWIAEGDRPLPQKYVVVTKGLVSRPEYTVLMSNWNVAPGVSDARFTFVPPSGAKRIDFIPLEVVSSTGR
jgi:hypothetical protein